jgi:hypothetical protein
MRPPDLTQQAELKVDGEAVGYLKTNLLPNSTIVFEGFCIAGACTLRGVAAMRVACCHDQSDDGAAGTPAQIARRPFLLFN